MAEGFKIATAWVSVSPDTEGFKEELKAKLDEATAGTTAKVKVGLDAAELDAGADKAKAKVDELNSKKAAPKAGLDAAQLNAEADKADAKLDKLDAKRADPKLGAEKADFDAKTDEADAKLDEMDAKTARPKLGLDDSDFKAKLAQDKAEMSSAGEGGGLLGGIVGGVGALMPGIGGAATGLGLLGATGALAFGGIAKALSEAHQASQNVGMTGAQAAATQFSNAVAVQQAQMAVGQAYQQSAQDAVTSANSIESAQMNLASVERNAAESQVQALESVTRAQQGVEQADYGLSEAQYQLTQAWEQAREQIRQLDDQLADSKLNVKQAELGVQQAEFQQRLIDQNAYSTSLDRQQAALAVAQAQQQVIDAQDQEANSAYAANLAHQQGVAGSQTVIQAKQAVTAATYQQQDAHTAYADAQRQLTLTELNNAAQVKQAQMQVAQVEEQAAYQQMRDAQQVAIAQRNVANTIEEQKLQWAATMSTENAAANQFLKDMSKLTPAGRAFVEQVLGMAGGFRQLEAVAQNTVLPGFTVFLQGVQSLMPEITSGVGQMGTAISNAFAAFGQLMQTPDFANALQGLITNGVQFANVVLPAFSQFVQELGWIGGQQGAVSGLSNLLAGIAHGLTGMAQELAQYMPQINDFLSAAGAIFAQIGPELGQIIGLVAQALEPLTHYLSEHPNGTIAVVLGDIVAAMILFKPLTSVVSAPFNALKTAVDSISSLPEKVKSVVEAITGVWGKFVEWWRTINEVESTSGGLAGAIGASGGAVPKIGMLTGEAAPIADRGILGATSAVGGAAGGEAGLLGGLGLTGASLALLLGVPALVTGIGYFADQARAASDRAKGVMQTSSGEMVAAWSVGGTHVSTAFHDLANSVATQGQSVAASGKITNARFQTYTQDWSKHNDTLNTVMSLGSDQFGQSAALFVSQWHGNVLGMADAVQKSGNTLSDQVSNSLTGIFSAWGEKMPGYWQGLSDESNKASQQAFQQMQDKSKSDYQTLQQADNAYEDDLKNGRLDKAKQDSQTLMQAMNRFMTDSTSGVIDNSNVQIKRLGQDLTRYMQDAAIDPTSAASQRDIQQLGKDLTGNFQAMTSATQQQVAAFLRQQMGVAAADMLMIKNGQMLPTPQLPRGGAGGSGYGVLKPGFAEGGMVHGPGSGTSDSIVARVSTGEYIVNAKSTAEHLPLLEAINARFANGGLVGAMGEYAGVSQLIAAKAMMDGLNAIAGQVGGALQQSLSGGVSVPGAVSGAVAQWMAQAVQLTGVGSGWIPDLETIAHYESSDNPNAINLTDSNAAAGDPSRGLMQTIMSTFLAYHQAGTSMNIYDPVANIAAAINYIRARYGTVSNVPGIRSLASGGGYVGYDSGGWLMPSGMPVNGLGKPEAVLTPAESEAFVQIVRQLTAQNGGGGSPIGSKQAVINFYGTSYPNAEQMAAIQREMGLALGGV